MKKSRFLVLALAVAVMLMGAGYAAWTDQLNINTEVKTGHLDVHFVDRGEEVELSLAPYVTGDVSYAQDGTGDNDWDIANIKLENMYPGAKATVMLKMQNNSTIPVEMKAIQNTYSANWGARDENFKQIGACVVFYDKDGNAINNAVNSIYSNPWEPAHLRDMELPVGGYAEISFTFEAADGIDEHGTYEFNPWVIWQQFNVDANGVAQTVETPLQGD
ncbi:MAG: hypothetical protein ACOYJ1_12905 [Peptococcales bacterium]|jgi:predicted ribosomally synthesized peptide with SipW-like signal peptide